MLIVSVEACSNLLSRRIAVTSCRGGLTSCRGGLGWPPVEEACNDNPCLPTLGWRYRDGVLGCCPAQESKNRGKDCESDSDDFLNLVGSAVKFKSAESAKRSVDAGVAEQPETARKRARKTSAAAQAGGSPSKPTGSPGKVTGAKKEPPRKTSRKLEKQELEINECAKVQVEAEQILTLLGCPAKFSMVKINAAQGCLKKLEKRLAAQSVELLISVLTDEDCAKDAAERGRVVVAELRGLLAKVAPATALLRALASVKEKADRLAVVNLQGALQEVIDADVILPVYPKQQLLKASVFLCCDAGDWGGCKNLLWLESPSPASSGSTLKSSGLTLKDLDTGKQADSQRAVCCDINCTLMTKSDPKYYAMCAHFVAAVGWEKLLSDELQSDAKALLILGRCSRGASARILVSFEQSILVSFEQSCGGGSNCSDLLSRRIAVTSCRGGLQ